MRREFAIGASGRRSTVAWRHASENRVTNLWHDHCIIQGNWDFSAQLENRRCRDAYFEPGDASLPLPWRHRYGAFCFDGRDIWRMAYDTATVHMLRNVLDDVLSSPSFIRQQQRSAVEVAERVLWLASQGEREPIRIKRHLLDEFLVSAESDAEPVGPFATASD